MAQIAAVSSGGSTDAVIGVRSVTGRAARLSITTYCHPTADDLRRRVSEFQATINQDPYAVADRLVVKDHLDPEEEKLRF